MITSGDINNLIELGESNTLEFKEGFCSASELAKEMCAFANSRGGIILFGVDDNGNKTGLKIKKNIAEHIITIASNNLKPSIIPLVEVIDKEVVVITIESGLDKPYAANGVYYIRVGPVSRKASRDELIRLMQDFGKIEFDSQVVKNATFEDLDLEKVKQFLERRSKFANVDIPEDIPIKQLLTTLSAIKNDKPTTAGILFFGKDPCKFIPTCEIKCARFQGTDMFEFIDKLSVKTTFLDALDEVEKFIKRNTRVAMKIVDFTRHDIPEYPYAALREAAVNALAHRDYLETGANVRVLIFDNRIEIDNPGIPPIKLSELEGKHLARNKILCQRFHDIGEMEEYGTGILKMKKLMKKHGLQEPVFEYSGSFFKVTFYGPGDKILDLVPDVPQERIRDLSHLNQRQLDAVKYLYNKQAKVSVKEYMEKFKVSISTARRDLKQLVEEGLITKTGKGRNTCYIAKYNNL